MNFELAVRRSAPLLIGIAGPSGGGKTLSALRVAKGMAGDGPIAFIDTEHGRALHYADDFDFLHAELDAPFSPKHYGEAIEKAVALNPAVIIVDSFTHEHAGEGGVLDMQQAEFERLGSREAVKFTSWIKPKAEHKGLVNDVLLRLPCHLIVCLRAEEKIELVKNEQTGKLEVVPKRTLSGHKGWIPVCGKDLPYELTISLVVTPDNPGVPQPIKLQEQHRSLVFTDVPLDEATGERLAAWAKGSDAVPSPTAAPAEGAGGPGTEPASAASDTSGASPSPSAADAVALADAPEALKPTTRQVKKLGVLVGTLRDQQSAITTENLWAALASSRKVDVDTMIALLHGRDDQGVLHFGPLLADLTREEASNLIDRLERLAENVGAAA